MVPETGVETIIVRHRDEPRFRDLVTDKNPILAECYEQ